jgi:Xaa-Pro dipeptidase
MISRRRFVQLGTVASAALGASSLTRAATAESDSLLPPSIASLQSMKSQAKPITLEERRERQEKARRLMEANRMDALLLMEGTSLDYFTGIRWWGGERLFAMVLPAKGAAFCVCPAFEEGRAREQIASAPGGGETDVRTWQEDDNPYQGLAQGLKDRGISGGTLGMEETVRFLFSSGIAQAAPQVNIVSGTPVTAGCRMVKSDHEIELMRQANKVTLTAYEATYRAL